VSVLEAIVEHKRGEVASRRRRRSLEDLRTASRSTSAPRDFRAALLAPGLSVIAEIKRRSPARGILNVGLDAAAFARRYEAAGAAALSVLTDAQYFHGSDADLVEARAAVSFPVLRKDFTIDPYQLYEARLLGADAILLIVRALDTGRLRDLLGLSRELGLAALVEVHDEPELQRAVAAGADILGVNNRNLDTLVVDPETCLALRALIPTGTLAVAESGISRPALARRIEQAGYDAILVGEALVTASDPGVLLAELRGSAALSGSER
jgi:indole-3-glycerol phosphate synthase